MVCTNKSARSAWSGSHLLGVIDCEHVVPLRPPIGILLEEHGAVLFLRVARHLGDTAETAERAERKRQPQP